MTQPRRKTQSEIDEERRAAENERNEKFLAELENARSHRDAMAILVEKPPDGEPGWRYYANLEYFFKGFNLAPGCTRQEMSVYLKLIQKMADAGEFSQGAKEAVEKTLRTAIDAIVSVEPWDRQPA
jgi:hypothetical protein